MYNTAPHRKRKQHTPSWPPAMTLHGNHHQTIQLESSGKLPCYTTLCQQLWTFSNLVKNQTASSRSGSEFTRNLKPNQS